MPSIPIQSITDLAAASVTGNETVPLVQQVGSNYFTYKTPIKNFFYNNAIPFASLSGKPLSWTTTGTLSTRGNLIVSSFIGIGTDTPGNRLTIQGSTTQYDSGVNISPNIFGATKRAGITLGTWVIGQDTNGDGTRDFFIYEGSPSNTTRFYVQSGTGRIGIGTTSPSARLDVRGSIALSGSGGASLLFSDTAGTQPRLSMQGDNNFVFYGTDATGAPRVIYGINQRSSTSAFNFTVPVNITAGSTTAAPLDISTSGGNPTVNGVRVYNSNTTLTSDAILATQVNGANSGDPKVSWNVNGVTGWSAGIDNSDSDSFKIANNWDDLTSLTRMVIDSTGHTSFLPATKTVADVAKPTGWGGGVSTFDVFATGSVGAGTPGVVKAYMNSSGAVVGVTFSSSSSIRFKDNVKNLSNSLDGVQKLRGVAYSWKDTGKADIGLIAEEVNEIYPEIVKKDESGAPEGIDYGKLTAVLIEAVKELTEKVSELENKLK